MAQGRWTQIGPSMRGPLGPITRAEVGGRRSPAFYTMVGWQGRCLKAVSKHLGVLRRARLVKARQRGREQRYRLDPRPLEEIYRDWLSNFAPLWEESLAQLKRQVEERP